MNADSIKRLRKLACEVRETGRGETCLLMIEAADELERLGKIEAAALQWLRAVGPTAANAGCDNLAETLEANSCPK